MQSSFVDHYTSIADGPYVEVQGYCRPLFVSLAPPSDIADGPNGLVLKQIYLDYRYYRYSGSISFYFSKQPKDSEKKLLFQICKGIGNNLAAHALVSK